ncbi:MAG: hypothetical protein JWM36_29 [Hyphomicrobiales bacterium]|nr:hypothetical protein [Hyphomicrobiales bacterium]
MSTCFFHIVTPERVISDRDGLAIGTRQEVLDASRELATGLVQKFGPSRHILDTYVHVTDERGSTVLVETVGDLSPHGTGERETKPRNRRLQ